MPRGWPRFSRRTVGRQSRLRQVRTTGGSSFWNFPRPSSDTARSCALGKARHPRHCCPRCGTKSSSIVSYIHGSQLYGQKRGVALNGASVTIHNCYISEIKGVGIDTQAIGGWNGPGPFTIENNYLEGAGENVLLGGSDPSISGLVTEHVIFRYNYVRSQWRGGTQSFLLLEAFRRLQWREAARCRRERVLVTACSRGARWAAARGYVCAIGTGDRDRRGSRGGARYRGRRCRMRNDTGSYGRDQFWTSVSNLAQRCRRRRDERCDADRGRDDMAGQEYLRAEECASRHDRIQHLREQLGAGSEGLCHPVHCRGTRTAPVRGVSSRT